MYGTDSNLFPFHNLRHFLPFIKRTKLISKPKLSLATGRLSSFWWLLWSLLSIWRNHARYYLSTERSLLHFVRDVFLLSWIFEWLWHLTRWTPPTSNILSYSHSSLSNRTPCRELAVNKSHSAQNTLLPHPRQIMRWKKINAQTCGE